MITKDFKFLGITATPKRRDALIAWRGDFFMLQAGEAVGGIIIKEVHDTSIRIAIDNREFILAMESE